MWTPRRSFGISDDLCWFFLLSPNNNMDNKPSLGSYRMEITDILASGEHSSGTGPAVTSSGRRGRPGGQGERGANAINMTNFRYWYSQSLARRVYPPCDRRRISIRSTFMLEWCASQVVWWCMYLHTSYANNDSGLDGNIAFNFCSVVGSLIMNLQSNMLFHTFNLLHIAAELIAFWMSDCNFRPFVRWVHPHLLIRIYVST